MMATDVKLKSHARRRIPRAAILALALLILIGFTAAAHFMPPSDGTVRQLLIQQSVASYLSNGQTCPCPYSLNRMGRRCLHQGEGGPPGGARSLCYPDDVSDAMVRAWRASHR